MATTILSAPNNDWSDWHKSANAHIVGGSPANKTLSFDFIPDTDVFNGPYRVQVLYASDTGFTMEEEVFTGGGDFDFTIAADSAGYVYFRVMSTSTIPTGVRLTDPEEFNPVDESDVPSYTPFDPNYVPPEPTVPGCDLPAWLPGAQQPITNTPGYRPGAGQTGGGLDPLVFDLDGDGVIELTNMNTNGIHFDYWADGFSESTGWVGPDDGMLVWDINGSGAVDSIAEMFGSNQSIRFLMESNFDTFRNEENGFARLAKQDLAINGGNGDGKIDASDAIWSQLKIWRDANQDGISQPGEMLGLNAIGINSIDVSSYALDGFVGISNGGFTRVIEGNTVTHKGSFTMAGGAVREVVDVWFGSNLQNTFYNQDYTLDVRTLFLPTMRGFGQIADLHIAMSIDNGAGGLLEQVQNFAANRTFEQLFAQSDAVRGDMRSILMKWAGIDALAAPDIKAHDMYATMPEFLFLRKLAGQDMSFLPTWFDGTPWMPWVSDGIEAVFDSWENVLNNFSARMIFQSGGSALFAPGAKYNPVSDVFEGPLALSQTAIAQLQTAASGQSDREGFWHSVATFIDSVKGVANLSATEQSWLNTAITASSAGALNWAEIVDTLDDQVTIMQSNSNVFTGSRYDDVMDKYWLVVGNIQATGGAGNDGLFGWNGNDTLDGGIGNDVLTGGLGNDTYLYDSGHDMIVENGAAADFNVITFGAGIVASDVSVHLARMDSFVTHFFLNVQGRGTITVMNNTAGVHSVQYIDELRFADGTVIAMTNMAATLHGTNDDNPFIDGVSWQSTTRSTINGYDGNDTLRANDMGSILNGGAGNDTLTGGFGSDAYIISAGNDLIDWAGGVNDTILVPVGYSLADVSFYRVEYGNTPYVGNTQDARIEVAGLGSITIKAHFSNQTNFTIPTLQFADGTTVNLRTQPFIVVGTSGDDFYGVASNWVTQDDTYLFGEGNDVIIEGLGGIDTLLFPSSYSMANITIQKVDYSDARNNLLIKDGLGNSVTVRLNFDLPANSLERLKFSDGTIVNISSLEIDSQGSAGDDTMRGIEFGDASLADRMYGYGGNDNISPGEGNDISYGGDGNDQIYDWLGNDILYGDAGNDLLDGNDGDDQLFGGTENDRLYGWNGNDTLDG
ncbi:MAG TPA: hypothetical protein DEA55_05420, partial [Rhodospirillaceae bacterium]|nr:hypothetical protein [Rhodospirillaceae bacterium]